MKKQLFIATALMLAVASTTGCTNKMSETVGVEQQTEKESSEQILTKIWGHYKENEKFFVIGGDKSKENAPDNFDLSKKEEMLSTLTIPESVNEKLDNAASMIHAMNMNTFTCSVLQFEKEIDLTPSMKVLKDTVLEKQWLCGFPEKMGFAKINDNSLAFVYGKEKSVNYFMDTLKEVYPQADIAPIISVNP